jgi:hypothetical protein
MTLALDDLNEVSVVIEEGVKEEIFGPKETIKAAVKNTGTISANGGKVVLTAKVLNNVFDYAVNNEGIIEARSLVNHNGVVELVAEGADVINTVKIKAGEAKIEVKEANFINEGEIITDETDEVPDGGNIYIEAEKVLHRGLISADAYNEADAGEIEIISNLSTVLDEGSTTSAACPYNIGNGGRILIDSLRGNTFVNKNAKIDVSAGSIKGDAGFIEISAYKQLGFYGILSGRAPSGYEGATIILDPESSTVGPATFGDGTSTTYWTQGDLTITGEITLGNNALLNLFADHKSATANDWDNGRGAILNPDGYTISAANGATNTSLNLKAGSGIGTLNYPIKTNTHTLQATNTTSGNINITNTGDLTVTSVVNNAKGGEVNITVQSTLTVESLSAKGDVSLTADGNIDLSGSIDARKNSTVTLNAGGDIIDTTDSNTYLWARNLIITNAQNIGGSGENQELDTRLTYLRIDNSGGDIYIKETDGALQLRDIKTTAGTIDITVPKNLTLLSNYTIQTGGSNKSITLKAGGSITQKKEAQVITNNGDIILQAGGNIKLTLLKATLADTPSSDSGNVSVISSKGSILDKDSGTAPDDYDIIAKNITLNVGSSGSIGKAGEDREIDLYYSGTINENVLPVISLLSRTPANSNGWNNTDVEVVFNTFDPNWYTGAGIDNDKSILSFTVSNEGKGQSVTGIAYDKAGNSVELKIGDINIDKTAPVITVTRSSTANNNGWYKEAVTYTYTATDNLSGIDETASSLTQDVFDTEGANQVASSTAIDLAGNTVSVIEVVNIDTTAPTVTITTPVAGNYNTPQVLTYTVNDNLDVSPRISGPQSGTTFSFGTHNILITATDLAGNTGFASVSFTIVPLTTLLNQATNSLVPAPLLPDATQFETYRINLFQTPTPVYFYHPLTEIDTSFFDELELDKEDYEFMDGVISIIGY